VIEGVLGAAAGVALVCGAYAANLALARDEFGLSEYRTKVRGLPDIVAYRALVEDGVVLLKNGAYLASWRVFGRDLDAVSNQELAILVEHVNDALVQLGEGWMLHVDALRSQAVGYPVGGSFPDKTTWLVDEERRALYESEGNHYDGDVVFSFTYAPPPAVHERTNRLFFDGANEAENDLHGLARFKATLENVIEGLFVALHAERLGTRVVEDADGVRSTYDEFLRFLHRCVTCEDRPVRLPDDLAEIDRTIADVDLSTGRYPKIGAYHVRAVAIERLPIESMAGMLHHLNVQSAEYRWSTRAIFLDEQRAERELETLRGRWSHKRLSLANHIRAERNEVVSHTNAFAENMVGDVVDAMAVNSEGGEKFVYYSAVVVLWSERATEVDDLAKSFASLIKESGCVARVETVNATEALISTWPGHGYENQRVFHLRTKGLINALPITRLFAGHRTSPNPRLPANAPPLALCGTDGDTPYALNLFVEDVGHTLAIGTTATGKSTLLNFIAASHFRYANAQVFVFDNGWSAHTLCRAAGGQHIVVGGSDAPELAPFRDLETSEGRIWAKSFVETLLRLRNVEITPDIAAEISRTIERLALRPPQSRRMSDLCTLANHRSLRPPLEYYQEGEPGAIFDAEADDLSDARYVVFELQRLKAMPERLAPAVLTYLFRRVEQRLEPGKPTLIVIDEAWSLLGDEMFVEQLNAWIRTLRKFDVSLIFATQNVGDITDHALGAVLQAACKTKIYLPNAEAESPRTAAVYESLGLNRKQIRLISRMIEKQDYYLVNRDGSRKFHLSLGPAQLAFFRGLRDNEREVLLRMIGEDERATRWPADWLRREGLEDWAEHWERGPIGRTARPARRVAPLRTGRDAVYAEVR